MNQKNFQIIRPSSHELISRIVKYFFYKHHLFALKRLNILFSILNKHNLRREVDHNDAIKILFNFFFEFVSYPIRIMKNGNVKRIFIRLSKKKMYIIVIVYGKDTKKYFLKKIDLGQLNWIK